MAAPCQRRYPFAPLQQLAKCPSVSAVAKATGFPLRSVQRWAHQGVTDNFADRVAIALGLHPIEVWPEWLDEEAS